MSPLTKAFVVLVTLLSILLVALVIPFVAQTDDLNTQIEQLKGQAAAADAVAKQKTADVARLLNEDSAENAQLQQTILGLQGKNAELTQSIATIEANLKEAKSQGDKLGAVNVLAQNSINQLTALLDDRTSALGSAQTENVDVKKVNAELGQRNGELEAQVAGLTRSNRILQEQLASMQNGGQGGNDANASAAPTGPSREVLGSVTGVQRVNDIILIQTNVGKNDQISANTQLVIFRNGSELVGSATVKTVDETVSVARVDNSQSSVQVGDTVMTGISY